MRSTYQYRYLLETHVQTLLGEEKSSIYHGEFGEKCDKSRVVDVASPQWTLARA